MCLRTMRTNQIANKKGRTMQTKFADRPLLSITEAGELLGVSVSTAYRMADAGQLPIIRLGDGGRMRVVRAQLMEQYGIADSE